MIISNKIISVDFNPMSYKGGIASFNRNLDEVFGDDISYITLFKSYEQHPRELNVGINKNLIFKFFNYMTGYRLSAFLLGRSIGDCEILILNSPSFFKFLTLKKRKVILVQHQSLDVMFNNKSNFSGSWRFLEKVQKSIDRFIVLSELDKEQAVEKYNFERDKVFVIRHMTTLDSIDEPKALSKEIIMLTRLDNRQKRIDLVIRAMKHLKDWNLNIYGDGPDEVMLKKILLEEKANNVIFHGRTSDIKSALDLNSIHVMSSDFEGYGISNIEAMRRGLPLIIRDTFPAARDLINNNGVLLEKNWSDEEFVKAVKFIEHNYEHLSNNSLSHSLRHSYENALWSWKNLIKGLFDGE
ncbi:glycosyltransferase [Vibrio cholerae]